MIQLISATHLAVVDTPDHLTNFPEQFEYFAKRLMWEYNIDQPSLDDVIPDHILDNLSALLNLGLKNNVEFCKILNLGKIYIGASCEEEGYRAIHKLDNIRKSWVS
jgi:hypothetical protein